MKTLYLLRHAMAVPEAPPLMGDHERILSQQGEAEAEKVASHLKNAGACPDFVLSSSAVRTVQTARIVMGKLLSTEGQRVEGRFDRILYLATPETLLDNIRATAPDCGALLCVGHNPGIAELAMALSKSAFSDHAQDFGTGTLAVFEGAFDEWQQADARLFSLKSVFTP